MAEEANRLGIVVHFGTIVILIVEKNSEPELGNPLRKMKGRTVFRGDDVWDQNYEVGPRREPRHDERVKGG